jgi:hypothetical protein
MSQPGTPDKACYSHFKTLQHKLSTLPHVQTALLCVGVVDPGFNLQQPTDWLSTSSPLPEGHWLLKVVRLLLLGVPLPVVVTERGFYSWGLCLVLKPLATQTGQAERSSKHRGSEHYITSMITIQTGSVDTTTLWHDSGCGRGAAVRVLSFKYSHHWCPSRPPHTWKAGPTHRLHATSMYVWCACGVHSDVPRSAANMV